MSITVAAGEGFEAPANADFTIRFKSPFTSGELLSAALTVDCMGPGDIASSQTAIADGEDVLLLVTPTMFSPGLWELNPVAVVAGRKFTMALAVGMNLLARGVSRYPKHTGRYAIQ